MMTDTADRPLVTFAVIAYNQERFIRETIEGAFAQTYEPLKIILTDDGSPDRTYQITQEMAEGYDGPHRVRINQNEPILGLVPHIDRVMELGQGEFIVMNVGDGISLRERTSEMVPAWRQPGKTIKSYQSLSESIEKSGQFNGYCSPPDRMRKAITSREILQYALHVMGATAGWDWRESM